MTDAIKNLVSLIQENLQKIPLAVRQWIYSIGALIAAIYTVWVGANGDWGVFWKSLIATAIAVIARGNATQKPIDPDTEEFVDEDETDPHLEALVGSKDIQAALAPIENEDVVG